MDVNVLFRRERKRRLPAQTLRPMQARRRIGFFSPRGGPAVAFL